MSWDFELSLFTSVFFYFMSRPIDGEVVEMGYFFSFFYERSLRRFGLGMSAQKFSLGPFVWLFSLLIARLGNIGDLSVFL